MEFKKKLKQRLYIAISYVVLGIIMNIVAFVTESENDFLSIFGTCLLVMGIVRILRHVRLTKSDAAVKQQEIAETDERNLMISERARSWAFSFSILLAGLTGIVLSFLGYRDLALPFAWFVCGMTILYWICWNIIQKKY